MALCLTQAEIVIGNDVDDKPDEYVSFSFGVKSLPTTFPLSLSRATRHRLTYHIVYPFTDAPLTIIDHGSDVPFAIFGTSINSN